MKKTPKPSIELDEYPELAEKWADYWEDENPPRQSKGAKPKMGISGRSIFDVARKMVSRYGKKK